MNTYSALYLLVFRLIYLSVYNATRNSTGFLQNDLSASEIVKKVQFVNKEHVLIKNKKSQRSSINHDTSGISNQNGTKRTLVDHFEQTEVSDIGKPYGDPDDYQRIGDDIYLIHSDDSKSPTKDVKEIKEALPDTEKSLTAIIRHLNKEDKDLLNENNKKSQDVVSDDLLSAQKTEEDSFSPNIENMSGPELNLLGDLQSSLKQHDSNTPLTINNILDEETKRKELEDEQVERGLATIRKAVESRDKEFIKNDPFAVDPKKIKEMLAPAGMFFKKDQTQATEVQNLIGYENELEHQIDPEVVVGGSRSHAKKRKRKQKNFHRHNKKHKNRSKYNLQRIRNAKLYEMHQEDENKINDLREELKGKGKVESVIKDNQLDTGFFIAEDSDLANLNKRTEDFVDNTVNATVVKIIDASKNTSKKDNLNKTDQSFLEAQLNSLTPDSSPKNKSNLTEVKHPEYASLKSEDIGLYKILKDKSVRIHASKNLNKYRSAHIINMEGKPGVQIDLYITDNKNKYNKKKRRAVRSKANMPEKIVDMQGQKKFFEPAVYDSSVEDVSLTEAMPDRHMFTLEEPTSAASEKLDATDHVEGNPAKKGNELQDIINNEELKHAVEESDLKGFDAIKNEIALQDAKSTVDFFNQPNSARPLSTHLSNNINDLTQAIKDSGAFEKIKVDDNDKGDDDPQKVKIILHIPETVSKEKGGDWNTQEALDIFTEQAKAYLNDEAEGEKKVESSFSKSDSEDDATLLTAKKIEALLRENALKEEEVKRANERIKLFAAVHNGIGKSDAEKAHFLNVLENSNAGSVSEIANISNLITLNALKNPQPTNKQDDRMRTTQPTNIYPDEKQLLPISSPLLELIKSAMHSAAHESVQKQAASPYTPQYMFNDPSIKLVNPSPDLPTNPATIKFNAPGVATPLRINGGKVIGGNVRGGNVIGGVISGGDFSGGEIQGGKIEGGTFKNGLMIDGILKSGVVEGGKIKGGLITGGDIKSGVIEGGTVKGGIIDGGILVGGVVEGGIFKGGTILGGRLIAGEMDGGILKNGSINGGVMKGGVIESGVLEGGTMLSGTLRGGIVKSGIINGGIIDQGVIVQDNAEIGPGVEIHEGVVKGGKISVNAVPQISNLQAIPPSNTAIPSNHDDGENRSDLFSIEVLPKHSDDDHKEATKEVINFKTLNKEAHIDKLDKTLEKNVVLFTTKKPIEKHVEQSRISPTSRPKQTSRPIEFVTKTVSTQSHRTGIKKANYPSVTGTKNLVHKALLYNKNNPKERKEINLSNINDVKQLLAILEKSSKNSEKNKLQPNEKHEDDNLKRKEEILRKAQLAIPKIREEQPFAHWSLTKMSKNIIEGDFGPSLHIYGGVLIHNGHAILDGVHGYLDAGDYQGECFSDPEVCETGFTIQMTVKVYKDSVFNKTKLFLLDSGATSADSRGISIFVQDGRIEAMVSTRETIWCLRKILEPYIEKWISLTLTWRNDRGLFLYINCDLFDKSESHLSVDCESCTNCHKTDRATRMFFGRPNKGPHFKVTHMALGEVSLYNTFSDKQDVEMICGAKNYRDSKMQSTVYQYNSYPQYTLLPSILHSQTVSPQSVPLTNPNLYPQKSVPLISSSQYPPPAISSENDDPPPEWLNPNLKKKVNKSLEPKMLNPWPTPANLIPIKKTTLAVSSHPLVDYNADRRSFLNLDRHKVDGEYSPWSGWSQCSKTCGEGLQTTLRFCNQPSPVNGGKSCDHHGPDHKVRVCMNSDCPGKKESVPVMRLEYGTKKSNVPFKNDEPMVILDGEKQSYDQLETAFEQLKH